MSAYLTGRFNNSECQHAVTSSAISPMWILTDQDCSSEKKSHVSSQYISINCRDKVFKTIDFASDPLLRLNVMPILVKSNKELGLKLRSLDLPGHVY